MARQTAKAILAGAAAIGMLVITGGAQGQSPTGARPSREPVMVDANNWTYTPTGTRLTGDVEVLQGQNRLRAGTVETAGADGAITRIEASGDVYYVTPTQTIRASRAVYTLSNATIVASGDVILTQGQNVITGAELTYNVDTGEARLSGGSGGRVQGVFYPSQD